MTLAVTRPVDFLAVNRFYGTSLDPTRIRTVLLPTVLRWLVDLPPTPATLLECAVHYRWARRMARDHDLTISTSNEWDLGGPGIQYVHYPRMYLPRPRHDLRWYHLSSGLVEAYHRACLRIGATDATRVASNLTLANSAWTARHFQARHAVPVQVLHPPVPGGFPDVPWELREAGFLCVGRISPEKRTDEAIEIIRRVRDAGHGVRLNLIGSPGDAAYVRHIRSLIERNRSWIAWHRNLAREDYASLLSRYRFGIHAMRDEHFGIVVAELVRAGCVPFVAASGGPVEIVGGEPDLCFESVADAVDRIVAVLGSPERTEAARRKLAARRDLFSAERFVDGFLEAVESFASPGGLRRE